MKKILLALFLLLIISFGLQNFIKINAHESLLDVQYDSCGTGENERWYYLCEFNYSRGPEYGYIHLNHELETIKYYFEEMNETTGYTWTTDINQSTADEIKEYYVNSMLEWNNVYYYSYDSNGSRIKHKVINIVEGTEEDHNLSIYPSEDDGSYNFAYTQNDEIGSSAGDSIEGLEHYHCNNWTMWVNLKYFLYNNGELTNDQVDVIRKTAGKHEMGHVLGLDDIDVCCPRNPLGHHNEVLMGYGESIDERQTEITYKDIAGVSVTRGFHTDSDHRWMKRENTNGTIDLICSLCNGVLYNQNMDLNGTTFRGETVAIYEDCVHYSNNNNCDMLLVASDSDRYFLKCQNCRHIETVEKINEYEISFENQSLNSEISLDPSTKSYIKLNIEFENCYTINLSSEQIVKYRLLDSELNYISMNLINQSNNSKTSVKKLIEGTYYIEIDNSNFVAQNLNLNIGVLTSSEISFYNNDILDNNKYNVNSYVFENNFYSGLCKITLTGISSSGNIVYPQNSLMIYDSVERSEAMYRLNTSLYSLNAQTSDNINNLIVFLNEGDTYYIDVAMENNQLSSLTISIEAINELQYIDLNNESINEYNIMNNETSMGDNIKYIELLEDSSVSITYDYNGYQEEFIYFVLFKHFYNSNTGKYEVQLVFPEMMVTYGESLTWVNSISAGKYYIGYFNKLNSQSTISISIS